MLGATSVPSRPREIPQNNPKPEEDYPQPFLPLGQALLLFPDSPSPWGTNPA